MNVSPAARRNASYAVAEPADPRVDALLRYAIAIGAMLVLVLPAARGSHALLGWLPLWLLAMPLSARWALHGFRLPQRSRASTPISVRRPGTAPQARRRVRPRKPQSLPRAA